METRLDRLPLRLNLSKRGLDIQSIMCPLCLNGVESNDHLFYTYEVASSIRRLIEAWCVFQFPNLISSSDWRSWIDNLRVSKDKKNRNPLYLHPNDSNCASIVTVKLTEVENYRIWSSAIKLALQIKHKMGFITSTCVRSDYLASAPLLYQWDRCNAVVLN
nr:putative Gag-polypeptide of LTR copia-type [Tanacetum cinerariifolium]